MRRVGIRGVYPSSFRTVEIVHWNIHPFYCPSVRGIYPWLLRYHQGKNNSSLPFLPREEMRSFPVRPSSRNQARKTAPVIELLSYSSLLALVNSIGDLLVSFRFLVPPYFNGAPSPFLSFHPDSCLLLGLSIPSLSFWNYVSVYLV